MKIAGKIIAGLSGAAILLTAVFLAGRYGWKVLGFRACQGAGIKSVTVSESAVEIRGFYPGTVPEGFCGCYAREQDGTLYVGVRFSAIFGFFETGDFDVTIPVHGEIHTVILKTRDQETGIWTSEGGSAPAGDEDRSAPDASDPAGEISPALTLPILDEIDQTVTIGTAGSSLLATQAAVKLLDWGLNTGLGADEIQEAASAWLSRQGEHLPDWLQKLSLVDETYQKLLGSGARELLDAAGCADTEIFWGSEPVEPVEAVMKAAGLRELPVGNREMP